MRRPWKPGAALAAATCAIALVGCAAPQRPAGAGPGVAVVEPVAMPASAAAPGGATSAAPRRPPVSLLAVGDLGSCAAGADGGRATARLAGRLTGRILLLGDIAYPDGTKADYDRCFWPSWRPLHNRVHAVIGNHDNRSRSTFFRQWPKDGTSTRPWYAFDAGSWKVLVVEGNCTVVSCRAGAPQTRWLNRRLAANPDRCTLLAIHQPRFSSDDEHGDDPAVDPIWRAAHRGGIDLVLAGHAHDYERIGPVSLNGRPNRTGPVLLVAGTGGTTRRGWASITPASKARINDTFGLLRLRLYQDSWRSQFLAAPSGTVRDSARGTCR